MIKKAWHYLIGNIRYKLQEEGWASLIRKHIREQIKWRTGQVSQECWEAGECQKCGCDIPQLLYANKSCGGKCYPPMMNKKDWSNYGKDNYSK